MEPCTVWASVAGRTRISRRAIPSWSMEAVEKRPGNGDEAGEEFRRSGIYFLKDHSIAGDILNTYDFFCDESAHLEHDGLPWMALGTVWCAHERAHEIAVRLREIKARHGVSPNLEIKWTKVGPAKGQLYLDILDYFFDDDDLHFRAVVVDKHRYQAERVSQDHDSWYYNLYFDLLEPVLDPGSRHRIYLDIKDTRSQAKVRGLHDVLCHSQTDFRREIVERVQLVRSHQVEQVQLVDLLIGAVLYANRELRSNAGKLALVERMRQRSQLSLIRSTLVREPKLNLYFWKPPAPAVP